MTAFVIVSVVAVLSLAIVALRRLGLGPDSPASIYLLVWGSVVLLHEALGHYPPLHFRTWLVVVGSTICFVQGCIHVWLLRELGRRRRFEHPVADDQACRVFEDPAGLTPAFIRFYALGLIALVAYVGIQSAGLVALLREVGGIGSVLSGEGIVIRTELLHASLEHAGTAFRPLSALAGLAGYVLFLGAITLAWGARLLRVGRPVLSLAPLVVLALWSIVLLQRAAFVYNLGIWLFAFLYYGSHPGDARDGGAAERCNPSRRILPGVVIGLLLLLVVALPLKARHPEFGVLDVFDSVASYLAGPLSALDVYLTSPESLAPAVPGGGSNCLWGVASILSRFGLPITMPPGHLGFTTIGLRAGDLTNVYTYLIYPILDFGRVGVLVVPYVLGAASTLLHHRIRMCGEAHLIPAQSILMTTVVMSFFAFTLVRDSRYVMLLLVSPWIESAVIRKREGVLNNPR